VRATVAVIVTTRFSGSVAAAGGGGADWSAVTAYTKELSDRNVPVQVVSVDATPNGNSNALQEMLANNGELTKLTSFDQPHLVAAAEFFAHRYLCARVVTDVCTRGCNWIT
jgi:hypothetical protein